MKFSPSQVDKYEECPQLWDFVYVQQLTPKHRQAKFDKGLYIHELMHVYYHLLREGHSPGSDIVITSITSRIQNDLANANADNIKVYRDVMEAMVRFITRQSRKIDLGIKILGVEDVYECPATTPAGTEIILHGIRDLVYKDMRGRTIIRDHKSSEKAGSWSEKRLELHGQTLTYGAVWYKMTGEVPIVEVNFINTLHYAKEQDLSKYFGLYRIEHTETVYEQFWDTTLRLIDVMLESPVLPHFGDRCNSCAFHEICLRKMRGTSYDALLRSNFEVTDRGYSIRRGSGYSQDNSTDNSKYSFHLDFDGG